MPEQHQEDEPRADRAPHRDGRVDPLGRALRATYDADNHDTLGSDVAGLMIDLSRVPYEPAVAGSRSAAAAPPPARTWRDRIGGLWRGGRRPARVD